MLRRTESRGAGPQLAGQAVAIPSYLVCGGAPLFHPLLAAAGLAPAAWFLHSLLWVLAPLNVLLLLFGFRAHRRLRALVIGTIGSSSILVHLVGHGTLGITFRGVAGRWGELALIRGGAFLLAIAAFLEWRYQRRLMVGSGKVPVEEYWRAILEGKHPALSTGRRVYRMMPASPRCKLCNAPFSPPGSYLMRLTGRSRRK